MKDKKTKGGKTAVVAAAMVEGALQGLSGDALYTHIQTTRPDTSRKTIIKAGLAALTDPQLAERPMLDAIYDLAMTTRFAETATTTPAEPVLAEPVQAEPIQVEPVAEVKIDDSKPEKKRGKKVA